VKRAIAHLRVAGLKTINCLGKLIRKMEDEFPTAGKPFPVDI
jgi:hypothetical protein